MNKVILCGRLTRDPNVMVNQGEKPLTIARWTLAVDRKFKREGEQEADFINCVAFGKTAEFIQKYFTKGMKMIVEGRITTGSYEKDGVKHYTTDVTVEQVEFTESKRENSGQTAKQPEPSLSEVNDVFIPVPGEIMEDLPFN